MESSGKCLCGAVEVKVKSMKNEFGACHCNMCRKWAGGPYLAVNCGTDVTWAGEQDITVYDSSQWAERGFCRKCGTNLFYRLKELKEYHMAVGLLDNSDSLKFTTQVFIDEKPENYTFTNETTDLTGKQLFEMYAPKD